MKRIALLLGLFACSFSVNASPIFHPSGENLTYGSISNFQSLAAHTENPATGAAAVSKNKEGGFGFSLIHSFGTGWEVGPVDNLTDQIDSLNERISKFTDSTPPTFDDVENIKADFDTFLQDAGDKGYFQLHLGLTPIAPIVWNSKDLLGGSLVFDINFNAQAQLSVLDRPIQFNPLGSGADMLQNNSAVYVKVAVLGEYSVAFGRPIVETNYGALLAGVRGKLYQGKLKKILQGFSQVEDAAKLVEDEMNVETTADTAFGADFGLIWAAKHYRVGTTFRNINSPSFDYDPIGENCDGLTGGAQDTCYIRRSFDNEIASRETWVMDPQMNVEAAVYSESRNLFLGVSADVSPVHDPVANEVQWFTGSVGYATTSWVIPGIRVGYRKNLAGTQLSAATAGFTLFKMLHLDVMYGLESTKIDGNTAPRMAQFNLGLDFLF